MNNHINHTTATIVAVIIIAYIIHGLFWGTLSGVMARSKNRDTFGYSALGFFFGIFGWLTVFGVPAVPNGWSHDG